MRILKLFTAQFLIVICFLNSSNAQRYYTLPDDPIRIKEVYDYNWLKKTSEKAINNVDKVSYNYLYSFMRDFFWEYRDRLTTIGTDQWASTTVFNWAKPYIKSKISDLDVIEKINLYVSLKRTQEYLRSFNYASEKKYLDSNESLFAYFGPRDYFDAEKKYPYPQVLANGYRESEAFMFRRIRSGVDKTMIETFLGEIISAININFSRQIVQNDEFGNPLYDFFWDRNQFKGIYREYEDLPVDKNDWTSKHKTWLKVIGEYQNGKKNGIWKYYNIARPLYTLNDPGYRYTPKLDYEIEYLFDKPIKLKEYFESPVNSDDKNSPIHTLAFTLDVPGKILNVDVYLDKKLIGSYNSQEDYIDYWDIYDTQRRILNNLKSPNLDIPNARNFSIKDKPNVPRNKETNNYTLYDDLKRSGKDHALLIAIDEYSNYNRYDKLKNPIRDAEAIASNLKNIYGFKCEIVRNPTKQELFNVLHKYRSMTFENDEQLLIFISGHGMYDEGLKDGYIVPKDGKDTYYDVSHSSWVSYTELSSEIAKISSNHLLLMVDACYSGALEQAVAKLKSPNDTIGRKMSDPKAWFLSRIRFKNKMFIASTSADRMTSDGINHSPFTTMFIRALQSIKDRDAYILDVDDVFAMLRKISPSPIRNTFRDHDPESSFFFVMQ